ncbi:hypothetical protein LOK49_LG03G02318 [Camellia lanceoleosa]|uniref:Uncharacterized protein n=1 Tax=Camellia lanceoleosa TaxID=1840588 RepID=A0ACC0IDM2_9ERIC|nr:hypothetical protein LOK49_LG03G02318 [Camellia lanceoleosa]
MEGESRERESDRRNGRTELSGFETQVEKNPICRPAPKLVAILIEEDDDEDEGEGASEVQGEVGVENVHGNEDGVPAMQQHNHVNMSREQLLQMGQWRDEVATSMWEAYNNK